MGTTPADHTRTFLSVIRWIGTGLLLLLTGYFALIAVAIVATTALGNGNVVAYALLVAYLGLVVTVPTIVVRRGRRAGRSLRSIMNRTAGTVLLIHVPLLPVLLAALVM